MRARKDSKKRKLNDETTEEIEGLAKKVEERAEIESVNKRRRTIFRKARVLCNEYGLYGFILLHNPNTGVNYCFKSCENFPPQSLIDSMPGVTETFDDFQELPQDIQRPKHVQSFEERSKSLPRLSPNVRLSSLESQSISDVIESDHNTTRKIIVPPKFEQSPLDCPPSYVRGNSFKASSLI
ncbi:hypothetical protein MauCBS54593_005324 [Microsporum audouinii]